MQDRDLDKIMTKWADDEAAAAPRPQPTAEMYARVVSLGRKRALGALFSRRLVWAAAGTALAVFVLVSTFVLSSLRLVPGMQIPQRAAFAQEKGPERGGPPPKGKGPRGGQAHFERLEFQVRGAGQSAVRSTDVLASQPARVVLAADDSYRLVLELAADRHVYVYQQSPDGTLVALYPNEAHSPVQNPARAGEPVYLPLEPNGFYLEEVGQYRLYVVAAKDAMRELETLYERYSRQGVYLGRRRALSLLRERLDTLAGGQRVEASGWTFEFEMESQIDRVE